jgi:hypothetical protein
MGFEGSPHDCRPELSHTAGLATLPSVAELFELLQLKEVLLALALLCHRLSLHPLRDIVLAVVHQREAVGESPAWWTAEAKNWP